MFRVQSYCVSHRFRSIVFTNKVNKILFPSPHPGSESDARGAKGEEKAKARVGSGRRRGKEREEEGVVSPLKVVMTLAGAGECVSRGLKTLI